MKVIEITPRNDYSCDYCQNEFVSPVVIEFWFFDSDSCRYKFFYRYANHLFPKAKNEKLFKLTKMFVGWSR